MTNSESVNLTRIMEREGILRIARLNPGYSIAMEGNILATGATVGEAYNNALTERAILCDRRAAA